MTTERFREPSQRDRERITTILSKVEKRFVQMQPRVDVVDEDYSEYRMDPFVPDPLEGIAEADAYTSNAGRVLADKIVSTIAAAERVIRSENDADNEEDRDVNNNAERVGVGFLRMADRRLENRGDPVVQDTLSFYASVRGMRAAARAMLIKDARGETQADILPMDPRNLAIQKGADEPLWAAYRFSLKRADVRDRYDGFRFSDRNVDDGDVVETVYDYYWREDATERRKARVDPEQPHIYMHAVIVDEKWARRPNELNTTMFPVVTRIVGANPGVAPFSTKTDENNEEEVKVVEDVGPSVLAQNRRVNEVDNRLTSYGITMAHRAVDRAYMARSTDGTWGPDENPNKPGQETPVSAENEEDIAFFQPEEVRNLTLTQGRVALDRNAGGLPPTSFGLTETPISGAALRILKSAEIEKLIPPLKAVESCILGCLEVMFGQYATGSFKTVTVSGKTFDRVPFNRPIEPSDIEGHGPLSVLLIASKPEDDLINWQIAQMANTPNPATGETVYDPFTIRERILKVPDANLIGQRVHATMAKATNPTLLLMEQLEATFKSGDQQQAMLILTEIQRLEAQKNAQFMAAMQAFQAMFAQDPLGAAAQGMGGNGAQQLPNQPGMRPEAMGLAGLPGADNTPSPDAGFNTTAPRRGSEIAPGVVAG